MSERNGYEHGVPTWIAGAHADPEQAAAFYTELWRLPGFFGGEPEQPVARYVVAVAMPGDQPRWDVDLWVDDPDTIADRATQLGGAVLMAPMDTPMGRRAVLADPQGGTFSVSRVKPA